MARTVGVVDTRCDKIELTAVVGEPVTRHEPPVASSQTRTLTLLYSRTVIRETFVLSVKRLRQPLASASIVYTNYGRHFITSFSQFSKSVGKA